MDKIPNQQTCCQTMPLLQLKKKLLPVDEYAARQGLSTKIVEDCGKLGLVQIRKHKGRTFVVDIPLSPYSCTQQSVPPPSSPSPKATRPTRLSPHPTAYMPSAKPTVQPPNGILQPGTISELVKKMFRKARHPMERSAEKVNHEIDHLHP